MSLCVAPPAHGGCPGRAGRRWWPAAWTLQRLRIGAAIGSLAVGLLAAGAARPAGAAEACRPAALEALRRASPNGRAIYERVTDKAFFLGWIRCDEAQFDLPTAVHESVHHITEESDAFPLVGGGEVPRPRAATRFFPPSRIAGGLPASDFRSTYLRPGGASSARSFLYLLDELNAYGHDLDAALALSRAGLVDPQADHRAGLAALMAFVAAYLEAAQAREPATWTGLQAPEVAGPVREIWTRAEAIMTASCELPASGRQDVPYLLRICRPAATAALRTILGREPVCPSACLGP